MNNNMQLPPHHPAPEKNRRTSSFVFPSNGHPKFSYAGVSRTQNANTEYTPSNYSRYGATDARPRKLSISPATILDNQYSLNQNARRRSYSSGIGVSPLRSPPIPLSPTKTKQPTVVWHSGDPVITSIESRRGSFQSPTSTLERSWNSNVTSSLALKHYSERLRDREKGVPMQERRVNSIVEKVFTGSDAIEWFLANMDGVTTVEKAQLTGEQLLKCGLITNMSDQTTFLGSPNSLYKFAPPTFQPDNDSETNNNSETRNPKGKQENQIQKTRCILI